MSYELYIKNGEIFFLETFYYFMATKIFKIILLHIQNLRSIIMKWNNKSEFKARVLELDKEIGGYVIVHELLHFNIPDHGKLWKSLMSAYLGDYKNIEEKLNKITNGDK